MARAKLDDHAAGLELVRHGLALALEHDLTAVAAELYQRLSVTLYEGADFAGAEEALDAALILCRTSPDPNVVGACVSCMAYVLRERGEWSRATRMCTEMIADGTGVFVAEGLLGAIRAFEGRNASARRLLTASRAVAVAQSHYNMTIDTTAALARVAAAEGTPARPPTTAAPCSSASRPPTTITTRWRRCAGPPASTPGSTTARARTPAPRR